MRSRDPMGEGRLHGPQARNGSDTPARPGKGATDGSPTMLRAKARSNSTTPPERVDTPVGSLERTDEHQEIARASSVLTLDLADVAEDREAHIRGRKCGGEEKCEACRLLGGLRAAQQDAARLANIITRSLWSRDSAALDAAVAKLGHWPGRADKGAWKYPSVETDAYRLAITAAPGLASGIASAVSHAVWQKWARSRFDVLVRNLHAPPHYRATMPLPVRRQDYRITELPGGGPKGRKRFLLEFTLVRGWKGEGRRRQYRVPLTSRDAHQDRCLTALASGEWRAREMKLEADRTRPGRWYARIGYSRLIERQPKPERWAGVNRGIICFIAAVTDSGDRWLYDGHDIEAYLRQIQSRRRSYQRDSKASARWGHGRARTLAPLDVLEAKGERWRKTKCQTIARRLAQWLQSKGVTHVSLEDFTGIRDAPAEKLARGQWVWERIQEWPYYQLQLRLVACLEELGIEAVQIAPAWLSGCPSCGQEATIDWRRRRMTCGPCRLDVPLDVGQATNVMRIGRGNGGSGTPSVEMMEETGPRR